MKTLSIKNCCDVVTKFTAMLLWHRCFELKKSQSIFLFSIFRYTTRSFRYRLIKENSAFDI